MIRFRRKEDFGWENVIVRIFALTDTVAKIYNKCIGDFF